MYQSICDYLWTYRPEDMRGYQNSDGAKLLLFVENKKYFRNMNVVK